MVLKCRSLLASLFLLIAGSSWVGSPALAAVGGSHSASHGSSYSSFKQSSNGRNLGLGVMLGEPTGLSLKYWTSSHEALDFGLTYSFNDYFALLMDYLWHFPGSLDPARQFVPYIGLGAIAFFNTSDHYYYDVWGHRHYYDHPDRDSFNFGLRIPLGLEFLPRRAPLGVFAEVVPGIGLIPGIYAFVQGVVGARFYF